MGVMPDSWIEEMVHKHRMIEPFAHNQTRSGRISFGVSSYGYDLRLADEYKIPDFAAVKRWDPKKMDHAPWKDQRTSFCWIAPNSFLLGRSLEYFRIPRGVLAVCQGKSTYARCGLIINVTPLEPEWEGYITISIVNAASVPVRVYAGEGIAQVLFLKAEGVCRTSYADRKGKYQSQKKIEIARLDRRSRIS